MAAHGNCWPTAILNCYILGLYYEFLPCSRDSSDSRVIFSLLICFLNHRVSRHFWVENVFVRPCVPCLVASSLEEIKSHPLWSSDYNTPASSRSFEALSFSPNLDSIHWITFLVWPHFYQSAIITAVTPPGPFRAESGLTARHVQSFRWDKAIGLTMWFTNVQRHNLKSWVCILLFYLTPPFIWCFHLSLAII